MRRAQDMAGEKFRSLPDVSANDARRLVVFEMEHREQFEEPSLLLAKGVELCLAIATPPWVRILLSARMRVAALHHTKMVGELATLRAVVSSAAELVLGRSPT
jgi:hypothetical protein